MSTINYDQIRHEVALILDKSEAAGKTGVIIGISFEDESSIDVHILEQGYISGQSCMSLVNAVIRHMATEPEVRQ